jgi:hypothetical protein
MKVKLIRQDRLGLFAPLRNVEPKKSVGARPQGRQFSQLTLSSSCGIDPAQLHGQFPSTLFYTAARQMAQAEWGNC